jgi:hypothetical protein
MGHSCRKEYKRIQDKPRIGELLTPINKTTLRPKPLWLTDTFAWLTNQNQSFVSASNDAIDIAIAGTTITLYARNILHLDNDNKLTAHTTRKCASGEVTITTINPGQTVYFNDQIITTSLDTFKREHSQPEPLEGLIWLAAMSSFVYCWSNIIDEFIVYKR